MGVEIICAFCGRPAQGHYGIHRDGFGVGPEVDLCDGCGGEPLPTLEEIWERIAQPVRDDDPFAYRRGESTSRAARPAKLARRRQIG